jgi:serine/threonine-protein kinase
MDPAFERVIVRCLESDPRQRPASAYAVLGALPGGDPLAAALAAGETPSPDLVANVSDAGGLSPQAAGTMFLSVLALVSLSMALFTHYYRPLHQSPTELSFRAASLLESFGYAPLPNFTASGFAARPELVERLERRRLPGDSLATAGPGGLFFYRRFSVVEMDLAELHRSIGLVNDPPQHGPGSVTVALDVDGRLLGLWAVPKPVPDSVARKSRPISWGALLAAAGLDATQLMRDSSAWLPPVACDSTARWTLSAPRPERGVLRVRAGAAYGKPVYFAVEDSLGSAIAGVGAASGPSKLGFVDWLNEVWWWALNLAGILLARRNLLLSRVDRRGAMRLAGFVFFATLLETIFTYNIPERGLTGLIDSILNDRALGHSLLHAGQMWVAYVAIEPYVRRLWPRMLVSWARLSAGRLRDPMVGRDISTGMLIGVAATLLVQVAWLAVARFHLKAPPDVLGATSLAALSSHGGLGFTFAFMCSVTVLDVLIALVACLLVHLVIRNERVAIPACVACVLLVNNLNAYLGSGWLIGVVSGLVGATMIVGGLFRFGLLTTLAAVFTDYIMAGAPSPFDPSAWYGVRGMVFLAVIAGLLGFSCWNALAGRPLFDDVLREGRAPAA